MTVTVIVTPSIAAIRATGSVTFTDGSTTIGTATLVGGGRTSFSTANLAIGSHSITAYYNGDRDYNVSTSAPQQWIVTVQCDPTQKLLVISPSPSVFGQTITLTATIQSTPPGAGVPTGSVTFVDNLNGVNTTLGSATLSPAQIANTSVATFTVSTLAQGAQSISAAYSGDPNFAPVTYNGWGQIVHQDSTTVLVSATGTSTAGQVTVTATVTANAPGSGTPTGTITFSDGNPASNQTVSLSAGRATASFMGLAPGKAVTITAASD